MLFRKIIIDTYRLIMVTFPLSFCLVTMLIDETWTQDALGNPLFSHTHTNKHTVGFPATMFALALRHKTPYNTDTTPNMN